MRYISIFLFCSLVFSACAEAEQKPNIVFIISDDLGAQSLACYGNRQCLTPNIDALARSGMLFTRTYTQFPVCGPSRAALMSGMYAQAIGVTNNPASEQFTQNMGDRPTMTQHFRENGYYTARVSKIYHMRVPGDITAGVDGPDHAASWTERFNCKAPEQWSKGEHEHLTNERLKPDPEQKIHYNLGYGGAFYVVRGSTDGSEQADHLAAEKAIEVLEKRKEQGTPFFLAVGMVRPHVPLVAPQEFFKPYPAEQMELPEQFEGDWDDIPLTELRGSSEQRGLETPLEKQKVLQAYYASVSYMDAQVGKILAALDDLDLSENTIVVFTADHGYHLGEKELWQKMHMHEPTARIPLIINVPGLEPGQTAALSQQIDIYPTLAQLCGLTVPTHIQGKSLVPAIKNPQAAVHESVYMLRNKDHLLRTDRWAYIVYQKGGIELYDMIKDPGQIKNLAESGEHDAVLKEMQVALKDKLAKMNWDEKSNRYYYFGHTPGN